MILKNTDKQFFLDHVVIVVINLDKAVENFKSLGFQVTPGGKFGSVNNALIFFLDGTYIELISMNSKVKRFLIRCLYFSGLLRLLDLVRSSLMLRFLYWFRGEEGIQDWCIRCGDLKTCINYLQSNGHKMTELKLFSRIGQDSKVAEWLLVGPKNRAQPFLIQDISPTCIRVPYVDSCDHSNKVVGISSITLKDKPIIEVEKAEYPLLGNNLQRPITLRLASKGESKGFLPGHLTSNAVIEIV